jgi:D-glycero-D-manno-heptose 1,7-bisphosphate phosphatase
VFLDRDGTMIHEVGYLSRLEDIAWYPGSIEAIRLFNRAGYRVVVITNQGGIGLGLFDEAFVREVHARLDVDLASGGARVDAWQWCPHHPRAVTDALRGPCACRKPGRGMIDAACAQHSIDLARSWVVGDRDVDLGVAAAVGARGVLVRTGHGARDAADDAAGAGQPCVRDLMEAAAHILTTDGYRG